MRSFGSLVEPEVGVVGHTLFWRYIYNSKSKAGMCDMISALHMYVQRMLPYRILGR